MLIKETLGCVKNFPKAIKWVHIIKMYHDKLKGGNLTMAKAENAEATNKTEKVAKATTKKAAKPAVEAKKEEVKPPEKTSHTEIKTEKEVMKLPKTGM